MSEAQPPVPTPRPAVAASLAKEINDMLATFMSSAAKWALDLGDKLNQAKRLVGHGKFEVWLGDNCGAISKSTAERYMRYAKNRAAIEQTLTSKNVKLTDMKLGELDGIVKQIDNKNNPPPEKPTPYQEAIAFKDRFLEHLKTLRHSDPDAAKAVGSLAYNELKSADLTNG